MPAPGVCWNVSDPSGVIFLNRVSRVVSTTVPKMAFDMAKNWVLEVGGQIQLVRFEDQPYSDGQENNNFNVDVGIVYRTSLGFDVLGQFGYYNINYLRDKTLSNGTPDVFGYTYRVGFRGQITERLSLEGLAGIATVETDFFPASGNDISDSTFVANVHFRYEATDKINFFLDFGRQYVFNGFGDPYTLINAFTFLANFELTEQFSLRGRLQSTLGDSDQVPYFLLPSLGSGSTLRGYRSWRFRDRHGLLAQGEWRWIPNRMALDMAFFYDAGMVAPRLDAVALDRFVHDFGVGIRFHGPLSTPLRVEIARGAEGLHLVFAAGAAF